jgi:2,4-dienoyl-CoA reductase-like NADH-dependent reductase (Old Yellow Enzyme family)
LDYISVSNGTHESYDMLVANSFVPMGRPAEYAGQIKQHVDIPVLAVGHLHDPDIAERIVSSGEADLVGMLRGLIADPYLPKRMAEETVD